MIGNSVGSLGSDKKVCRREREKQCEGGREREIGVEEENERRHDEGVCSVFGERQV